MSTLAFSIETDSINPSVLVYDIFLLLLNNFTACTLVNVSVIMTVVNVVGFVRFWDNSIDVVSLCTIVVVVGICVDYPVHIIHCYLVSTGNLFKSL